MTPLEAAQAQLVAYNARDLDAFVALHAEDVELHEVGGGPILKGRAALRERYAARFSVEGLRAEILHRARIGDRVIDHERVWLAGPQEPPVDVIAIYTVEDGAIARVDFVR